VGVTDAGVELIEQAHAWQEEVFARLTEGWSERRRTEFHKAMASLVERSNPSG
jgi:DNA-binding MarR family transcriptional regulator